MSIAWLFPGQGSQSVGMGKDVLAVSAAARAVFERVDEALGQPLTRLVLEGPEEDLTLTANAQPAILTTSCAILAAMHERVPDLPLPAFAAGHSLGEYSALVAGGAISLEDASRLVRARGRAMQQAVPAGTGAMSAILGLTTEQVETLCKQAAEGEVVSPANFNAPGQVVVAGHAGAVARAGKLASEQGGRVAPLKVSAPFHCALMAPAARAVEAELARIQVMAPSFPVLANFDARPSRDPDHIKDRLVRQVDGAVRWDESIRRMFESGMTHAIEIGRGKVLAGLVKRIAKEVRVLSVGDAETLAQVASFVEEAH